MNEKMIVTTPAEYTKLKTKLTKLPSGAVFKISVLGPQGVATLLNLLPDAEGDTTDFVKDNFVKIIDDVIGPSILEPKIEPREIIFMDAVQLLTDLMTMSGITPEDEEEIQEFQPKPDGADN